MTFMILHKFKRFQANGQMLIIMKSKTLWTNKLTKDSGARYQFLRLDQPQSLSVAALNELLKGQGVLEGQGAAFSEAAKSMVSMKFT